MKIKSIKTELVSDVSKDDWEKMKRRGDARKFKIISNADKPKAVPADLEDADYAKILQKATKAFKDGKFADAKELYEKADGIKSTPMVKGKIADCVAALEDLS